VPTIALESDHLSVLLTAVRAGLGVATLPAPTAHWGCGVIAVHPAGGRTGSGRSVAEGAAELAAVGVITAYDAAAS
jgi:DNA-binding transcriptional LysR family regulator